MKRSWHAWLAVILSFLTVLANTPLVWAEVTYSSECIVASTSETNTTVGSLYVTADPEHRLGYYITQLKVSWEIQPGDSVRVRWWDGQATELQATVLDTGQVSVREQTVTAPSSACTAQIELTSGTATGNRYAWIKECTNNYGNTTVFVDPDIPTEPPPEEPPPEEPPPSGGGTDLSGVITELQNIGGQLTDIGGDVATIKSRMSDVISGISEVTDTLDTISSQLDTISSDMNSQFNAVKNKLDVISSDLAAVKSDVATLKNYFTTPRIAGSLQVNPMPQISFDSTVPDMSEPYQEPYTYDRPDPTMPPAVFGPEPLPFAPEPQVMPHDAPAQVQTPIEPEQPVNREEPRSREPVTVEQPLTREQPRQTDAVIKEPPLSITPPLNRETPLGADAPLARQTPFTPSPPLTPNPPLTPGE